MSPAASTRWCPTPEQLMILEEMYRAGVKTPNATQIQQITAHLSLYGKIEGKNVFYWFQNHKARDRQKLRRKLCRQQQQQMQMQLQQQMQLHLHPAYHPHHYLFDQPSSASLIGLHPFHHLESLNWLPQEGLIQDTPSQVMMNYSSKMHTPTSYNEEMDNWTKMYSQDCMRMMMDMADPTPPCCSSNRPLKTLQLFPVNSSSSLKDECTTSFNSAVSDHQLN